MKLDSEHLEILAVIVEKGGLTEGAEALGKSQPSVSRTMSLLEERVGAPLFEPGKRPLRPTELGESLARLGARIHKLNLEAATMVSNYRRGHTGRLRIAGTPIFMDGVVSTLIADFQSRHTEVQIAQSYGYSDSLTTGLRNGTLDMAIVPMYPGVVPADMAFVPLLPGRNVIACRADHPLTRRSAITLADIVPYPAACVEIDRQRRLPHQLLGRHLRLDRQRSDAIGLADRAALFGSVSGAEDVGT